MNAEKKLVAVCKVDRSGWYSVRRVAEVDGKKWSIYWAVPETFKRVREARRIARAQGRLLPGIYRAGEIGEPYNLLTPIRAAA